jgi:hypothetical protein
VQRTYLCCWSTNVQKVQCTKQIMGKIYVKRQKSASWICCITKVWSIWHLVLTNIHQWSDLLIMYMKCGFEVGLTKRSSYLNLFIPFLSWRPCYMPNFCIRTSKVMVNLMCLIPVHMRHGHLSVTWVKSIDEYWST